VKKSIVLFVFYFMYVSLLLSEENSTNTAKTQRIEKEYGSFNLPVTFAKSVRYSTKEKDFYVKVGEENEWFPNNVSVNIGKSKYALDDHLKFKDAIMRQLLQQLEGSQAQLEGSGSYTEQGYVLYAFVINDENCTTTQYYIVGDHTYVLVHETVEGESKETDEATLLIINSFRWKE